MAGEPRFDPAHGKREILLGPGPARRINSRVAAERPDDEPGIVG